MIRSISSIQSNQTTSARRKACRLCRRSHQSNRRLRIALPSTAIRIQTALGTPPWCRPAPTRSKQASMDRPANSHYRCSPRGLKNGLIVSLVMYADFPTGWEHSKTALMTTKMPKSPPHRKAPNRQRHRILQDRMPSPAFPNQTYHHTIRVPERTPLPIRTFPLPGNPAAERLDQIQALRLPRPRGDNTSLSMEANRHA
jgi:hypothetical protein